eukprot:156980_1
MPALLLCGLLFPLVLLTCEASNSINGSTLQPKGSARQLPCFDGLETILLAGGTYSQDIISFNISSLIFQEEELLSIHLNDNYPQAYTQIHGTFTTLYFINDGTRGDSSDYNFTYTSNVTESISNGKIR